MLKSITRAMLTSTMSFAWRTIKTGERIVEGTAGWSWGSTDQHAGFAERFVRKTGLATTAAGVRLEQVVNAAAMRLGYRDGEVSGWLVDAMCCSAAAPVLAEPVTL